MTSSGEAPRPLVIVGGGEHARVVSEAAQAAGWTPVGYTAPGDGAAGLTALDRLGTDEELAAERAGQPPSALPAMVIGFGGPLEARRRAVDAYGQTAAWAVVIHPAAWVSPSARVDQGAVILAGAIVNAGAVVGAHAIVNSGAIVEHDVRVGAYSHVAPGATIGGGSLIGEAAFVGMGAAVRDHVIVGDRAVVGMGAVVVGDVPPDAVVMGAPARPGEDR